MTQPVSGSQGVDIPARYKVEYADCCKSPVPSNTWEWDRMRLLAMHDFAKRLIEELGAAERALRDAETRQEQAVVRVKAGMLEILANFFDDRPVGETWTAKSVALYIKTARRMLPSQSPEGAQHG